MLVIIISGKFELVYSIFDKRWSVSFIERYLCP